MQERSGSNSYEHESLRLQYKLDNEFELVFVVAYQKILQLSYIDKFLNDVHLLFRDKYKDELKLSRYFQVSIIKLGVTLFLITFTLLKLYRINSIEFLGF